MSVIVSDDSPHNAEMYGRLIRNLGCQVAVARTEAGTLTEARRTPPDLVVTDNQKWRDNSSGLRMTEELAGDPSLSEIVVIMASADPIEAAFLWNGGDHFIHKRFGSLYQVGHLVQEYLASEGSAS
jgi:CheY-like chemotaxis protein